MSAPQVDDSADILTRRCIVQLTRGCKYAHCTNPYSARCSTFQKPPDSQLRQKVSEMVSEKFVFPSLYLFHFIHRGTIRRHSAPFHIGYQPCFP